MFLLLIVVGSVYTIITVIKNYFLQQFTKNHTMKNRICLNVCSKQSYILFRPCYIEHINSITLKLIVSM